MIAVITIIIIGFFIANIILIAAIKDEDLEMGVGVMLIWVAVSVILLLPFIAIDRSSGDTIGTITSVDKNFFGSTAIYIKTSETEQERYCAEDKEIIQQAKKNLGKKVKISYGTRIGLYPLRKCHEAPIDKLEEIKDE